MDKQEKVDFYSDTGRTVINPKLFSETAEKWAQKVCESGVETKPDKKTGKGKKTLAKNKISQIRKFYDDAIKYGNDLRNGEDYALILPYLKMLNAKVAYAEGRKLVTPEFKTFMKLSLDQLSNDHRDYEVFASFFEAFMGYYKYFESQYKDTRED